jgi:hypothetical protein
LESTLKLSSLDNLPSSEGTVPENLFDRRDRYSEKRALMS